MTRRGLTLIETLASLTLLSALALAVIGWMQIGLRDLPQRRAEDRWFMAAEAVVRLIEDASLQPAPDDAPGSEDEMPRLVYRGERLELALANDRLMARIGEGPERLLLAEVAEFDLSSDDEDDRWLIRIRSWHGATFEAEAHHP